MSSRSPLLLLSGSPAAAASAVDDLAASTGRVRVVAVDGSPADPALVALVEDAIGRLMGGFGADPLPAGAWTSLASAAQLSALWRARAALADPEVDAVVLAAGSPQQARELVALPAVLVRLLDAALTPRLAMWRTPDDDGGSAFEGLSRLRGELTRLAAMLEHPRTTLRLVVEPGQVGETVRLMPVFGLLGVGVEGVAAWQPEEAARRPEGPDRSFDWFVGPWPEPVRLTAEALEVVGDAESGFELLVPLVGDARREAEVGRCGAELVVAYQGQQRWLPLPAALARCRAREAVRGAPGLRIRFTPDPELWPRPAGVPA